MTRGCHVTAEPKKYLHFCKVVLTSFQDSLMYMTLDIDEKVLREIEKSVLRNSKRAS